MITDYPKVAVRIHNASGYPLEYATEGAAGLDLRAVGTAVDRWVHVGERLLFGTGIRLELPVGFEAQVRPRSGMARNHGVMTVLGTIDADYRGEIGVLLINHGDKAYRVAPGDRIAQLVIAPVVRAALVEVADPGELAPTARGAGGFGSTGR